MHQEIQRGSGLMNTNRAAIKYEKEAHASNLEQGEAMEKSMISMDHEIEKLRTELANAEKRARAGAAAAAAETPSPGYAAGFRNPEMRYGWSSYPDVYAMHQLHFRIYKELRMRLIQIIQLHCAREALRMLNGTQLGGQKIRLSWGCSSSSKLSQPDPNQWNGRYYGCTPGYETYGYVAAAQDPNLYYRNYPGYGNY